MWKFYRNYEKYMWKLGKIGRKLCRNFERILKLNVNFEKILREILSKVDGNIE